MSSKGRGRESVPFDFYPTPPWCTHRLLDRHGEELLVGTVDALEPTVGDGAIVRAVNEWIDCHGLVRPRWTACELRKSAGAGGLVDELHEGVDFRAWQPSRREPFDFCPGNPPFSIAEGIVRHALKLSEQVAMLLRVGFLGAGERYDFWHTVGADPFVRVLPDRPSFDGEGTDSSTYAWFVWGAELSGPRVDVLEPTPVEVRRAQAAEVRGYTVDPRQVSLFGGVA